MMAIAIDCRMESPRSTEADSGYNGSANKDDKSSDTTESSEIKAASDIAIDEDKLASFVYEKFVANNGGPQSTPTTLEEKKEKVQCR